MKFNRQYHNAQVRHPFIDELGGDKCGENSEKRRLQSTWKMVDGQLICQWTTVCE